MISIRLNWVIVSLVLLLLRVRRQKYDRHIKNIRLRCRENLELFSIWHLLRSTWSSIWKWKTQHKHNKKWSKLENERIYRKTFAPHICCVNFDNTRCRASEMFPYLSKRALCFTLQRFSLIIVSTVEARKFRADTESSAA